MKVRGLLLTFWLAGSLCYAQQRSVSGTVTTAAEGEALPGVAVRIKNSSQGTVTDVDGKYRLEVPSPNAVLVFSFIGYVDKEETVGNRSVIDVKLAEDVEQLKEVVVTAIGIEREQKALGYAVSSVEGESVQQVAEPDPLRALQGKVAGVNIGAASGAPGSSTRITIRGNSSLLGNNQPLFVVDGVPYNNDFITSDGINSNTGGLISGGAFGSRIGDLDPNNIESITILKGGAAAALYGTRAANGVVVITTKAGSTRAIRKGTEVTYSVSYGIEKISNLPDLQNSYGTGTNFSYAQANGSWGAPFEGAVPYPTINQIPHWYAGRSGWNGLYDTVTVPYRAYPNNVKDFFETGTYLENSLTFSGGNESSAFSATISYLDQGGFVPNTDFNRLNLSIGGNSKLENGVRVGGTFAYTSSEQNGVISGVGNLGSNNPSAFARTLFLGRNWDLEGQPYQNPTDLGSEFFVGRGTANSPYWAVENTGIKSTTDRYVATLDLSYDIADWLTASNKLGLNGYNSQIVEFQRPNGTGSVLGTYSEFNVENLEINNDFLVSAFRDFNEDWTLRALVGTNVNQRTNEGQQISGTQYVIFDIEDLDNMGSVTPTGGIYARRRLIGVYGDVNLGYRDWAFFNVTGRNDWTSTLAKGNNSFFYPAVTGSIILSDAFDLGSKAINYLKLRAGWSEVGSDTDPYQLFPTFLINNFIPLANVGAQKPFQPDGGTNVSSATLENTLYNPELAPETTREIEVGVDSRLFNNRFGLDVSVYRRLSFDQIVAISIPEETGFTSFLTNAGEISNKGIEITTTVSPYISANGFNWTILGTFTHNRNVVEDLPEGLNEIQLNSSFAGNVRAVHLEGHDYGLIQGSRNLRDDEGNLLIDPANGQMIRDPALAIIGNPNPDFNVGLVNTFSYKGVYLRAVLDWRQGGDIYSETVSSALGRGVLAFQANREMNWVIPGVYGDPNTLEPIRGEAGEKFPNQTMIDTNTLYFGETYASNGANEWNVWDGTTYRLREVALGYTLPNSLLDRTPFGNISLTLTGRNLWFLAPNFPEDMNYDPETNQFGARNAQGIEFSTTPSAKRYTLNLKATF